MSVSTEQGLSSVSFNSSLQSISAVSWGAIFAGAVGAAAMSLILLILGMGLGLSSVSPWTHSNMSGQTLGIVSILWIFAAAFLSSGLGGYLAGRLRSRWLSVPIDEVHFRDTAHGFLAWAIATLGTAILLTTVIGKILMAGVESGVAVAGGLANTATVAGVTLAGNDTPESGDDQESNGLAYTIDTLFRRNIDEVEQSGNTGGTSSRTPPPATAETEVQTEDQGAIATDPVPQPAPPAAENAGQEVADVPPETEDETNTQISSLPQDEQQDLMPLMPPDRTTDNARKEITNIVIHAVRTGSLAGEDLRYGAAVLADALGVSREQAEQRINEAYTAVREAETAAREMTDDIRAASAKTALWLFISLLIGAFTASLAATWGGRQRDL